MYEALSGTTGLLFLQAFNALGWAAIVWAIGTYQNPRSAFFPVILGFAFLAVGYGSLDLTSSSTAALGLVFIPIAALPLIFVGWLVEKYCDRKRGHSVHILADAPKDT